MKQMGIKKKKKTLVEGQDGRTTDSWVDERMDGWMNRWMDEWMDE